YFDAQLPRQFDAVLHFDRTKAVQPLELSNGTKAKFRKPILREFDCGARMCSLINELRRIYELHEEFRARERNRKSSYAALNRARSAARDGARTGRTMSSCLSGPNFKTT